MSSHRCNKIWSNFQRINKDGIELKFNIEDVPEDMWTTAVEFMLGSYIKEDVWWVAAGTAKDPEAVEEYRVLLTSIIRQRMCLACFLIEGDGSGRTLVGLNMCLPQKKGQFVEHRPPKTKAGLVSLRMFVEAMKVTAIYDTYGVEEYLMGAGLSVTPEYRGMGIAAELLNARFQVAKSRGFSATGGIFTSESSQKTADKVGMDCLYCIPYSEFGKTCSVKFDTKTENLKIFGKRTE